MFRGFPAQPGRGRGLRAATTGDGMDSAAPRLPIRALVACVAVLLSLPMTAWANPTSPPSDLWQPPTGATPDSGTYVYLESAEGDYIGLGQTYLYTPASAQLQISHLSGEVKVSINGDEWWNGLFDGPTVKDYLEPGYYGELRSQPSHDPEKGGLSWSGEGRGCDATGWFMVDEIAFEHDALSRLRLRFAHQCGDGGGPPLHGEISYDPNATTSAEPNPRPIPDGLWQPAAVLPTGDTYVHLESTDGDWVGNGGTYSHTPANASIHLMHNGGIIDVSVQGEASWEGSFTAPDEHDWIEQGYYGELQRYPFHNPVEGGLSWSGEGRGCNTLDGWFVVDDVTFSSGAITSLLLRFEQSCGGEGSPPLHGEVRWNSSAAYAPPGTGGTPPYNDIDDSPHRDAIIAVSHEGIASGYSDGTYRPGVGVTRAQMATFLARALQLPPPGADAPRFTDTAGNPHEDAIRSVAAAGIADGYGDGSYRPSAVVRRDQMASFLSRGFDLPPASGDSPSYTDTEGNVHEDAIQSVAQAGIAHGYSDGTYRPYLPVNRGQMAALLARSLGLTD